MNPIKIFSGSFGGQTLFENPFYVSPNTVSETFIDFIYAFLTIRFIQSYGVSCVTVAISALDEK